MGTVSTGVGLISGLDYQSIVDQLIAVESGPRDQILNRIGTIDAQRTAYLEISAHITSLLSRMEFLTRPTSFRSATASSSLPDVLSATASGGTRPGTYNFVVRALATTHQVVSRGFTDRNAPLTAGTLTIESGQARVNTTTTLEELNGHTGVRRGSFEITNKAGQKATIKITDALSIGDVIDKINAADISVTASIRDDGLLLTDTSAGSGALRVREVDGGFAAADLGFGSGHSYTTENELAGSAVLYLAESSPLAALNDGRGVRSSLGGSDFIIQAGGQDIGVDMSDTLTYSTRFERLNHGQGVRLGKIRITSRDSTTAEVDLSAADDMNDVKQALEAAFGDGRISVVLTGSRIIINDKVDVSELEPEQISDLAIEDVTGHSASDLGIDGEASEGKIDGRDILHMDTLADAIGAINYAPKNVGPDKQPLVRAVVSDDQHGITLYTESGAFRLKVPPSGEGGSQALHDLGLKEGMYYDVGGGAQAVGGRVMGGIDTVLLSSLNGGAGFSGTTMRIEANGLIADLDLSSAETVADVIELINNASQGGQSLGVEAGYDPTGTRLVVSNLSAQTPIKVSGDFADELGLSQTGVSIKSGNLQRQYVAETTLLEDLNAGRGISRGSIKITNSRGGYTTLDLSNSAIKTVGDVIEEINLLNLGVEARINSTGDGLLLVDTAGGSGKLKIEEDGGNAAHDLNILGEAKDNQIDGSYEFNLDVSGSDTLESLAARVDSETTLATATLLNDGSAFAPYRLSISSLVSGAGGELVIDGGDANLGLTTLTRAQDARVFFGGNSESGVLLTSSTNTFDDVVDGLSLMVSSVSDDPVTVKVERDLSTLIDGLKGMAEDYNSAMDQIKQAGDYDEENEVLGILQGESTLRTVENRLYRMFGNTIQVGGAFSRLSEVGIEFESGNKLSIDETKFRAAFESDPDGMLKFFTDSDTGVAVQLKDQIDKVTGTDGLIPSRTEALGDRKELLQERVDVLNDRLERKRAQLLREFQAMESALAQLQAQQSTLTNLASMAQNFYGVTAGQ